MDGEAYFRYLLALVFVVGLILAAGWGARRFGMGLALTPRVRGQNKRISITEMAALDGRRRLVLIRRDGTEHLILLGATHETVLETGIVPPLAQDRLTSSRHPGDPALIVNPSLIQNGEAPS